MNCTPNLSMMSSQQIGLVHECSLEILSSTGVKLDSERARDLIKRELGSSAVDGERVYLSEQIVEWAIESAPSTVQIFDRLGKRAFQVGDQRARFGIGVTNLYYQDPRTDQIVSFQRQHMEASTRLGNSLPWIDLVSTVGVLQEYESPWADFYAALEMIANTTKPLVLLVSDEEYFPQVLDLIEHSCGYQPEHPAVIPYFNPITPLVLNQGTVNKMFTAIERGYPFIYSSYGMAGMTAPITPAGSLTLLNAELLAGLVLSQLIRKGSSIILGSLPMFFDMKKMTPLFDPLTHNLNLASAEMMHFYQLPHCGTSGSGEGWGMDLIGSGVMWANHLASTLGRSGLCPFVGSNFGSLVFSPLAAVYADEVIAQSVRIADGFELSKEAINLEGIQEIGPGGDYLASDQTYQHFRDAYYHSEIFPVFELESWQENGSPLAEKYLREQTLELMEHPRVPDDHEAIINRGDAFIEKLKQG